ncbi:MAG: hypothetical protein RL685_919 [Pseudomonadota bacterium]
MLGIVQLILLAGLSFALLLGCLASCGARWVLSSTALWSPARRHGALFLLCIAPMVFAALGVLAVLAPSFLALLWPEYDHCLRHDDHHVHVCLVHLPEHLGNTGSWLVLSVAVGWIALAAAGAGLELYRAWRCTALLREHGRADPELGANVLPTSTPLCLLAGIFRPTLFLSRGLLAAMGPESVAVLLHHERAHAARRDLLLRLLARAGTLFLWPSVRKRLLEALELAAEQSCDEVAAHKVGDRLQVADAILRVERLLHSAVSPLAPLAVSFGGATVPQRVSALLEAPRRAGNLSALGMVFASLSLSTLAASAPLHHWTESLLEALVH